MNVTALNTVQLTSTTGWILTFAVFIGILFTLFLLSKNLRQFLYGAGITTTFLIVYKLSRYVGVSTTKGNWLPFKYTLYIIGFIIVSIVIGYFVQNIRFIKDIEKYIEDKTDEYVEGKNNG